MFTGKCRFTSLVQKENPPFFNVRALIMHEILRSNVGNAVLRNDPKLFCFCWSVRLCEDFIATVKTSEVGPVPGLLVSFLQQAVASVSTIVGPLSACLPENLVR